MSTAIPVRLSIRAKDLPNTEGLFRSPDPYAIVKISNANNEVEELGRTEVIKNTTEPTWATTFSFNFQLGKSATILICVYDDESDGNDKSMGGTMFSVGKILGCRGNSLGKRMKGDGVVYAHIEKEVGEGKLMLQLRGLKLKNVEDSGFFSKSDPFFEIAKKSDEEVEDEWVLVYRSEHVKSNLNPLWNSKKMELSVICNGDVQAPLKISVFDYEGSGDHIPIGSLTTTVNELVLAKRFGGGGDSGDDVGQLDLVDDGDDFAGSIAVLQAQLLGMSKKAESEKEAEEEVVDEEPEPEPEPKSEVEAEVEEKEFAPPRPTFVDYISGGCEVSLYFGIDYTGSNGDPREPGTLHYLHTDGSLNDYEKAIVGVGSILSDFDLDKQFPVWGFGAKFVTDKDQIVRHAFQVGGDAENGIGDVLEKYRAAFNMGLILSNPTDITQVMRIAANRAKKTQEDKVADGGMSYSILLIITDGAVSDIDATKAMFDEITDDPISVAIVGVGDDDFGDMQCLAEFGNATFVELNACGGCEKKLAEETLKKIPDQLVDYFLEKQGIEPSSTIESGEDEIEVQPFDDEEEIALLSLTNM